MSEGHTKSLLMDTAERLFAQVGIEGTSLRQIINEAGVNLASIHYHFGSKEALVEAVLFRRLDPLNRERLRLLTALEIAAGDRPVVLERVLEALFGPSLRLSRDACGGGECFMRMMGRMFMEPNARMQEILFARLQEVFARFTGAVRRALPKMNDVDFYWRIHFLMGVMCHTMGQQEQVRVFSGGLCDPRDVEGIIQRMVAFVAAGLRAGLEGSQR